MGNKYDVIIVGAGPGGIFSAYELVQKAPNLKVAVFEAGHALEKRLRTLFNSLPASPACPRRRRHSACE